MKDIIDVTMVLMNSLEITIIHHTVWNNSFHLNIFGHRDKAIRVRVHGEWHGKWLSTEITYLSDGQIRI